MNPLVARTHTDWTLCCLCQDSSSEELRCPLYKECHHKAYETLADDLKNFVANDVPLPLGVNLECFDDGSGVASTLLKNKAKYHNRCRSLFRSYMVERKRHKRREKTHSEEKTTSPKKTRLSFCATLDHDRPQCVYCEKYEGDGDEPVYRAWSANCRKNLLQWATESRNWVVYARLNAAISHYHRSCYTKLNNDARAATSSRAAASSSSKQTYDPLVIAQLVAFLQNSNSPHKLSVLRKLYDQRLKILGSDWIGVNVHPTRFKEHLLHKLGPEWCAFQEGKEIYISHKKTVGTALAQTAQLQVTEDEAEKIVEVGLMLRKYVLMQQMPFKGSFTKNCLSEPVPKPLLTLIDVLLEGSNFTAEEENEYPSSSSARIRVACTVSQLICSNASKYASKASSVYQRKERETPFPLYVGLSLHANDRQKGAISIFHSLGMSVSYDRVKDVRRAFARAVSKRWAQDGVVVPTNMKRRVFVTSAVDNLDESGRCEFHGTAMTLTSHVTHENEGEDPPPLTLDVSEEYPIQLPDDFAVVPYIDEHTGDITLLPTNMSVRPTFTENSRAGIPEEAWLKHAYTVLFDKGEKLQEMPVTYSGFFSYGQQAKDIRPRATVGIFPVFYEKASSMAMQKHSMLISKKATEFVNPGQIPVIVGDCPLYAQQKKCQWRFPDEIGESKMVCFLGFLHTEMASQQCGGKLLAGSGWERMFSLARVFTPGVATSLLGSSHVKRTRYSYQLTLAWIHALKVQAYNEYCQSGYGPYETMEMWEKRLTANAPTVCYWLTVQEYLMICCRFLRGQRMGDWPLTLSACEDLCPWFFAFGHTNYARWMPVFLKDMACLPHIHPDVHKAFMEGKFVVQRSEKKFSMMALDQSQEHSIKFLKDDSGPKGQYGQPEEKEIIELSKPEVLRIIDEFETSSLSAAMMNMNLEHQESSVAEQNKFLKDLKSLLYLVKEGTVVNPFKETGPELVTLDSGEVMDPMIANSLKEAPTIGKAMFAEFVHDRIESCSKPLSDVIPRTSLYTFNNRPPVDFKKGADKLGSAKASAALITRLFLSLQGRPESDIHDFFRHENQREPPSLSDRGKLITSKKSALLGCLPGMPDLGRSPAAKETSVVVVDMPAVIHIVKPQRATVFGDYAHMHLLPFLESQMNGKTTRLDAIWDTYPDASIKSQTHAKRGECEGQRTRVSEKIPIPKGADWQNFLKESVNKNELFRFLSEQLVQKTTDKEYHLFTTKNDQVLSNRSTDVSALSPCSQEEADSRMMLHLRHAAEHGHTKAYLRTVDTDVVVLAIYHFHKLTLSELWIGFGSGKTFRDIPIHHISQQLGPQRSEALLFFHSFTGCDVTSAMFGVGKKTAWKAWSAFPEVTETFIAAVTQDPANFTLDSLHMQRLEQLTVLMYSKNCQATSVNEARKLLFTVGLKPLESIPPTQHALFQHMRRALLVAAFIWKESLSKTPNIPSPSEWGWQWNSRTKAWVPHWTDLPDASKGCSLLLHCGCSVACKGNCKCHRAAVRCSPLCKCGGGCTNSATY